MNASSVGEFTFTRLAVYVPIAVRHFDRHN